MVKQSISAVLLLSLFFIVTQCSKNPTAVDQKTPDANTMQELYTLESEIDTEHESVLTDTTDENLEKRFRYALFKLNKLLRKARRFVIISENEEAKQILEEAYTARNNAVETVKQEDYELAFEYIKESAYLAIEAVKLIREEVKETIQDIQEKLVEKRVELKELLDDIKNDLNNQNKPRARYVYRKAVYHYQKSGEALHQMQLRKTGFHIRESFKLAYFAQRILQEEEH